MTAITHIHKGESLCEERAFPLTTHRRLLPIIHTVGAVEGKMLSDFTDARKAPSPRSITQDISYRQYYTCCFLEDCDTDFRYFTSTPNNTHQNAHWFYM